METLKTIIERSWTYVLLKSDFLRFVFQEDVSDFSDSQTPDSEESDSQPSEVQDWEGV